MRFAAAALGLAACVPAGLDGYVVTLEGGVADGDGAPIGGAAVELLGDTGEVLGCARSDGDGRWSWPIVGSVAEGNVVSARTTAPDHAEGLARWEVSLLSAETAVLRAGPGQDWQSSERALASVRLDTAQGGQSVRGRIVDLDGVGVSGLPGIVQRGWDAAVGSAAEASFTTGEGGAFSATVDTPGLYTVYVTPVGEWAGTRFPVLTTPFSEPIVASIAPAQAPGRLVASLWWVGALDLDLHLTAPEREADAANARQRFHVWADEPVHTDRSGASTTAALVRSATTGPGPEVIEVYTPVGEGELRLSVMDRTNAEEADNVSLGGSRALVQWWNGEDIPRYAWVSPLERATTWRLAELDTRGGAVYAVEAYTSGADPADDDAF
jgi:hypothetical protein